MKYSFYCLDFENLPFSKAFMNENGCKIAHGLKIRPRVILWAYLIIWIQKFTLVVWQGHCIISSGLQYNNVIRCHNLFGVGRFIRIRWSICKSWKLSQGKCYKLSLLKPLFIELLGTVRKHKSAKGKKYSFIIFIINIIVILFLLIVKLNSTQIYGKP